MITSLFRIIRAGWRNFIRNGGISAATIFIMVLTISLISSLFMLSGLADFVVNSLQEKVDISVYFKQDATEEDILKARDEIEKIPEVKEVHYISREEALDKFIARYKNDPVIMESLQEIGNPLLSSLNIKAWEASQYGAVSGFFSTAPYKDMIDKIDYLERQPVIDRLFGITKSIRNGVIGFSAVLGLFAILVAFNAIKLAIHDSREEIGIMRLVGASNLFIRAPFLVQGAIAGITAVIISMTIFSAVVYFLSPRLEFFIPGFDLYLNFNANLQTIILVQLITGVGLGVISSGIAVRKYLRV